MKFFLGSVLVAVFGVALSSTGCDNECDFFERCDGDTLEVCGEGADQVTNRKLQRIPCEAPNATCRAFTDDDARCVFEDAIPCDDTAEDRCDGDLLLTCPPSLFTSTSGVTESRYFVATDCRELNDDTLPGFSPDAVGTCVDGANGAACGYE